VTTRKSRAGGEPRIAVELDGQPWAEIEAETLVRHGLKRGKQLSHEDRHAILKSDAVLKARRWAAARCARKPRSRRLLEHEMRRRGMADAAIHEALDALEASGTVNDREVAARHLRKRAREGGFGPARLRMELLELGIPVATAEAALADAGSAAGGEDACLELARKRAPRYAPLNEPKNRNRLLQFLQRRGFEGETIRRALETVESEAG
jgi:regulatory protein